MSVELIKALHADLKELQSLSRRTFSDAFAADNTEENMQAFLDSAFSEEKLKQELSETESEFYLARQKNSFIGYLKVNFGLAQTELKESNGMEIERIYVLKEFIGKGLGRALLEKALAIAKSRKAEYLWLGVWEKNSRAIGFYQKNGFIPIGIHPFPVGKDVQTDILMKRNLG